MDLEWLRKTEIITICLFAAGILNSHFNS